MGCIRGLLRDLDEADEFEGENCDQANESFTLQEVVDEVAEVNE